MIPKNHRVNSELFTTIFENGKRFTGRFVYIKVLPLPDTVSRFSFVVSKKVIRNAADRNSLKRRGVHAFKELLDEVEDNHGVLFFLKESAVSADFGELKNDIKKVLQKADLLR